MREQLAHPDSAPTLPGKAESRRGDQLLLAPGHSGHSLPFAHRLGQLGLEELVDILRTDEDVRNLLSCLRVENRLTFFDSMFLQLGFDPRNVQRRKDERAAKRCGFEAKG